MRNSIFPVIFLSHGAPTLALNPGRIGKAWSQWAASQPKPEAIVVISAHWQQQDMAVTSSPKPKQLYDFYGFPQQLSRITYQPKGDPGKAAWLANHLREQGIRCMLDQNRGFDHGVWIPVMYMYPEANIPVLALSLPASENPAFHYQLGQALQNLTTRNILCIGSGGLTHNLSQFGRVSEQGPALPFVPKFRTWMLDQLRQRNLNALFDYRQSAPTAVLNHPTEEHLMPLFVCLGAAQHLNHVDIIDLGVQHGMLAMDVVAFSHSESDSTST